MLREAIAMPAVEGKLPETDIRRKFSLVCRKTLYERMSGKQIKQEFNLHPAQTVSSRLQDVGLKTFTPTQGRFLTEQASRRQTNGKLKWEKVENSLCFLTNRCFAQVNPVYNSLKDLWRVDVWKPMSAALWQHISGASNKNSNKVRQKISNHPIEEQWMDSDNLMDFKWVLDMISCIATVWTAFY